MNFNMDNETTVIPRLWYRYDSVGDRDYATARLTVFVMIKKTPCGAWIKERSRFGSPKPRWVSDDSRRRHAYPTKEEAMASFQIRQQKRVQHLENHLAHARLAAQLTEDNLSVGDRHASHSFLDEFLT